MLACLAWGQTGGRAVDGIWAGILIALNPAILESVFVVRAKSKTHSQC